MEYLPRVVDAELAHRLSAIGAVLIEGPKACGKTATATQVAQTVFRFDEDSNARTAVSLAAETLFDHPTPILFDEWQEAPELWNRVRRQVDDRQAKGQFILTGSATPNDDVRRHSGAGRIGVIRMRPMSLFESGHSNGQVSLSALFEGEPPVGKDNGLTVPDLFERIVVGGWPSLLQVSESEARAWLRDYLRQVAHYDVPTLGPRRSPNRIMRLFEALGRGIGQPVALAQLAKDVGGDSGPVANETIYSYVEALDRLMLTDNSEAWKPHMRSATRLRTSPVRYFVDPSLGTAALDVGTADLLADLNAAGFHFESLVLRDLRIYAQSIGAEATSWRDANQNEVDAVVTIPGGRWGAFEVKLNPEHADRAAAALLKLRDNVDTSRHGGPAVLGVITSTGFAYRRPDGVDVLPISAMAP